MTQRSICLPDFPAVLHARRYSPSRLIEMRDKSVAPDGCRLKEGQQLFESFPGLLDLINQGRAPHRVISLF
jgi:hypothetical protein